MMVLAGFLQDANTSLCGQLSDCDSTDSHVKKKEKELKLIENCGPNEYSGMWSRNVAESPLVQQQLAETNSFEKYKRSSREK